MKKLIFGLAIACCVIFCSGWNKQIFDWNYTFNTAYVKWPDGTMKTLKLKSWKDYEGEQIQLIDVSGTVYLVSSINCVLTSK